MALTKVKLIADGVITSANLDASHGITTSDIGEGSNLYYTDARVSSYLSTNGFATQTDIVAAITDSAPVTLDTLNELAAALGDDANFSTTVTNNIATKMPLAGGTFTGNVEIASTSAYQAKIKSTGAQYLLIGSTDAGSAGIILDGDSNGDGSGGDYSYLLHEASGKLKLQQDSPSGTNELHFGTAGIESRMVIDSSGDVGIGTTSPDYLLHLEKSGTVMAQLKATDSNQAYMKFVNSTTGDGTFTDGLLFGLDTDESAVLWNYEATALRFATSGAERMRIDSSGTTTITNGTNDNTLLLLNGARGRRLRVEEHNTGNGGIAITSQDNDETGTTNSNNRTILLNASGGNVGIGTTSPSTLLHISGNSNSSDNILTLTNTKYDSTNTTGETGILFGWLNHVAARITAFKEGTVNRTGFKIIGEAGYNVPTTIATFRSTGLVGIGTTSPSTKLHISAASSNSQLTLERTGSATGKYGIYTNTNNLYINNVASSSFPLVILNNGNVGIGTTSPTTDLDVFGNARIGSDSNHALQITDDSAENNLIISATQRTTLANVRNIKFRTFGSNGTDNILYLNGGNGNVGIGTDSPAEKLSILTNAVTSNPEYIEFTDAGSGTGWVSGQDYGGMQWFMGDGTGIGAHTVAQIKAQNEHTGAAGNAALVFSTAPYNTVMSERMRIDSSGNVLFGTQGLPNGTSIYGSAFHKSNVNRMILRMASSHTGAAGLIDFFNPNGQVGYIATNGTATQYVTSSDYRLKEDLQDFNGLDKVSKIPVYDFKWKSDENRSYGVIAHELQEVLPDAVSGDKDAINEDGSIEPQGVDYSKIVPLLVKSIQELKADNNNLRERIQILENQ